MRMYVLILASLALVGCTEETGLWVEVQAPGIEDQIDRVVMEIVASRQVGDSETTICAPIRNELPYSAPLEWPFWIVVLPGSSDWSCVAVRVTGYYDGDEVIRNADIYCPDWDIVNEEVLLLSADCLNFPCERGQVCREPGTDEECWDPIGNIFNEPIEIDRDCQGGYYRPPE